MITLRIEKNSLNIELLNKIKDDYKKLKSILKAIKYTEPFDEQGNILTLAKEKLEIFLEKNQGLRNDNISLEDFLKTDFIKNYKFDVWSEYSECVEETRNDILFLSKINNITSISIPDFKEIEIRIFDMNDNMLIVELLDFAATLNKLNEISCRITDFGMYGNAGGTRRINFATLQSTHNMFLDLFETPICLSSKAYEYAQTFGTYNKKDEIISIKF